MQSTQQENFWENLVNCAMCCSPSAPAVPQEESEVLYYDPVEKEAPLNESMMSSIHSNDVSGELLFGTHLEHDLIQISLDDDDDDDVPHVGDLDETLSLSSSEDEEVNVHTTKEAPKDTKPLKDTIDYLPPSGFEKEKVYDFLLTLPSKVPRHDPYIRYLAERESLFDCHESTIEGSMAVDTLATGVRSLQADSTITGVTPMPWEQDPPEFSQSSASSQSSTENISPTEALQERDEIIRDNPNLKFGVSQEYMNAQKLFEEFQG